MHGFENQARNMTSHGTVGSNRPILESGTGTHLEASAPIDEDSSPKSGTEKTDRSNSN